MGLQDLAQPAPAEESAFAILRFGDAVAIDHHLVAGVPGAVR